MKFDIFQIPNSKLNQENILNIFRGLLFSGSKKWNADYFSVFSKVNTIEADSLNEVFDRLNLWDKDEQNHRSLSVGDIIFNGDLKEYYIVDNFGFSKISVI